MEIKTTEIINKNVDLQELEYNLPKTGWLRSQMQGNAHAEQERVAAIPPWRDFEYFGVIAETATKDGAQIDIKHRRGPTPSCAQMAVGFEGGLLGLPSYKMVRCKRVLKKPEVRKIEREKTGGLGTSPSNF